YARDESNPVGGSQESQYQASPASSIASRDAQPACTSYRNAPGSHSSSGSLSEDHTGGPLSNKSTGKAMGIMLERWFDEPVDVQPFSVVVEQGGDGYGAGCGDTEARYMIDDVQKQHKKTFRPGSPFLLIGIGGWVD